MAIDWKKRAKKFEAEALAAHKTAAAIGFCLEKEKALHRRTCEQANALDIKLKRATTLLCAAAENFEGHGLQANADALRMTVTALFSILRGETDDCARPVTKQDEQV